MTKPTIFTVTAVWDDEAKVWSGHCDAIPAATSAASLDQLLQSMSAITLDLLPDNHPDVDASSVFLQLTALYDAEAHAA